MKKIILLCLLITFSLFISLAEIVSVPGYNFSINPLEGWKLQPYESDSTLSWFSDVDNIALSVTSWTGSEFTDIKKMFDELTVGFKAYGDCVLFTFLGFEGAIGEVGFEVGGRDNKGWMIFLNGEDFDYYLSAFTLIENYEKSYSEIQSVLDSFSPGESGELNPGPISAFLNQSPSRTLKKYTVDFFDHPLTISISDYDFTTAQSIIEREADIMLNYSNKPKLFYNAWKRYYQIIFRDNYSRLDPLFKSLYPYFSGNKYSDYELVEILMFWIQGYTYQRKLEWNSDLLNPLEASINKIGDCDTRSLILGILLHKFHVESILLASEKVKHAILAVNCPGDGYKYTYQDEEYLTLELTSKALIGEIKESIRDPELWTPMAMEYSNGF